MLTILPKLRFREASGVGRHLVTPRYAFRAQNAFYGLVAGMTTQITVVK